MLYRWRPDAPPSRTNPERPAPAMPAERFEVAAEDGYPIRGGIWHADTGPVVVLHAATAVQARYYARFASWLSGQGATVLTFDYRGIGESRSTPVKDLQAIGASSMLRRCLPMPAGAGRIVRSAPWAIQSAASPWGWRAPRIGWTGS